MFRSRFCAVVLNSFLLFSSFTVTYSLQGQVHVLRTLAIQGRENEQLPASQRPKTNFQTHSVKILSKYCFILFRRSLLLCRVMNKLERNCEVVITHSAATCCLKCQSRVVFDSNKVTKFKKIQVILKSEQSHLKCLHGA